MAEYADRDPEALGETYVRHVAAMTAEGLHAKSDIAAELAFRDLKIKYLATALTNSLRRERRLAMALAEILGIADMPVPETLREISPSCDTKKE